MTGAAFSGQQNIKLDRRSSFEAKMQEVLKMEKLKPIPCGPRKPSDGISRLSFCPRRAGPGIMRAHSLWPRPRPGLGAGAPLRPLHHKPAAARGAVRSGASDDSIPRRTVRTLNQDASLAWPGGSSKLLVFLQPSWVPDKLPCLTLWWWGRSRHS